MRKIYYFYYCPLLFFLRRTDWMVYKAETLMASTSFEYVVTPLQDDKEQRMVARVGYDATFRENYTFWVGPYDTEMTVKPSKFSEIVGTFGIGGGGFDNLRIEKVSDFAKPSGPVPIILNPNDASINRERAGGR